MKKNLMLKSCRGLPNFKGAYPISGDLARTGPPPVDTGLIYG